MPLLAEQNITSFFSPDISEQVSDGDGNSVETLTVLERVLDLRPDIVHLSVLIVQGAQIPIVLDGCLEFPDVHSGSEAESVFPTRKTCLLE